LEKYLFLNSKVQSPQVDVTIEDQLIVAVLAHLTIPSIEYIENYNRMEEEIDGHGSLIRTNAHMRPILTLPERDNMPVIKLSQVPNLAQIIAAHNYQCTLNKLMTQSSVSKREMSLLIGDQTFLKLWEYISLYMSIEDLFEKKEMDEDKDSDAIRALRNIHKRLSEHKLHFSNQS
jgi:hypothetical protein